MCAGACLLLFCLLQPADFAELGLKALEEGRYQEAAELLQKASEAAPDDYSIHFHLGIAYGLLKRFDLAAASFQRTLELKPGLYEAELNLGMVLLQAGRSSEAIAPLEAALRSHPQDPKPNYLLGEALLQTRDLERAEQHFRAAVRAETALRSSLLRVAEAWESGGNAERALRIYLEFPEDHEARRRAGMLLLQLGKPSEAVPHLAAAADANPSADSRVALAKAYRQMGQLEAAEEQMRLAVQSAGQDPELRLSYGRLLRDRKKYAAAASEFREAVKLRPTWVEAWNELAGMLLLTGDYPGTLAALDRIRELGGETASHHYVRALVHDRMKQPREALHYYRLFLELSQGKFPEEEFTARQRARVLERELKR